MLGQLVSRGSSGLESSRQYGDTALAGGVLSTLLEMVQPETSSHCLVSDILHNCSVKVPNVSYYRKGFEAKLPE